MTLQELAVITRAPIVIRFRLPEWRIADPSDNASWYASLEHSETTDGRILSGSFGNGRTPEEALSNYSKEISGKTLVFGAHTDDRREFVVPLLDC